jgi:ABC-2 type transport system permease protein
MTTHPSTHPPTHPSPWQPVGEIIRFELQESLRTSFVLLSLGFFFALGLLVMHVMGTDWPITASLRQAMNMATKPGELVPYANSPLAIMQTVSYVASIPLAIVVSGIFAERATKDFTASMDGLLFTSPLKEWQFLAGRFASSFLISLVIFLGLGLGLLVGSALPWMAADRIGPFSLLGYLQPYLYFVIPNILIFGLLSFALGLKTRRTLPSYLAIVGVFFVFLILGTVIDILHLGALFKALVNPFGLVAVDITTQFWTQVERNTRLVPLAPAIWLSRLLWLGLSGAFFASVWRQFSFSGPAESRSHSPLSRLLDWAEDHLPGGQKPTSEAVATAEPTRGEVALMDAPAAQFHYGPAAQVNHGWRIARMEVKRLIWNPLVLAVLVISILVLLGLIAASMQDGSGLPILPATTYIVEMTSLLVGLLAPLLIVFLAGDLVWRDREARVDPLTDPLPVRSWALVMGKLLALGLILALVLVLLMVGGVLAQTVNQYANYELGVYAVGLFGLVLVDLLLISVLAITIQVLVNQKFLGYAISAFIIIVLAQGSALFRSVRLLHYGYRPKAYYSPISGFGNMLEPVRWFQAYWLAVAILLVCVATLFWVRGVDTAPKQRWRIARQRFTRPMQIVVGLSAVAALLLGIWIFYNTQILNPSLSRAQANAQFIAYEKAYGDLVDAQPKITAIDLQGDLYPEADGRFAMKGTYTLANQTSQPIDRVLLNVPNDLQVNQVAVNGNPAEATMPHPFYQVYEFALADSLAPGAIAEASFDLLFKPQGFTGEDPELSKFLENGLNVNLLESLPYVGYYAQAKVRNEQTREAAGLPPIDPAADAAQKTQRNAARADVDGVMLTTTLSTAADQIAITSGELVKDWIEGDRRYFQYQTQTPIELNATVISGRYEVLRDQWQDVAIELYYHPGHDRNLDRMASGMKQALDYATQNFGPFPHKTLRLVEVPYVSEAVSYPTTIIRGERFGYLAKIDDNNPTLVDDVFRIAAHEVAHQWWGQQLRPSGNLTGAKILTESLAEYTANQVYAQEYGLERLGIALKSNLNTYLSKRDQSDVPLVEATANHLVYQKGGLAMFTLQDYIGEEAVNGALANLLTQFANVPPYPAATDLVAVLRAVTPEKYQYLITDLFETVTLYDNLVESATVTPRADGQFDVTLTVNTAKVRSDNVGNETATPINQEEIDVGVYDAEGKLIYLEKHPFSDGASSLTITVGQQPIRAGIDPLHKLIDKLPDDNVVVVTAEEA